MSVDTSSLLSKAVQIAGEAGSFLIEQRHKVRITESSRRDVKVDADRLAENLIIERLRTASGFAILSEETGSMPAQSGFSGYRWIVDPIDGTMNYLRGIPLSCVSIALWQGQKPLMGVVYNFCDKEMFTGIVGQGAALCGNPIHVSETAKMSDAILFTGFPVGSNFSEAAIVRFAKLVMGFKKIRSVGTAALALAYVAAGRGDAYYEQDIRIWDIAAGLAIVLAAGGRIRIAESTKPDAFIAYAGNSRLEPLSD